MKWVIPAFRAVYGALAVLFAAAGISLVVFAVGERARAIGTSRPAGAIEGYVSAPTRVRRYLMHTLREDPARLPHAASVGLAAALLLAGWGAFIWFNRSAEALEPEAMADAKREDRKLK